MTKKLRIYDPVLLILGAVATGLGLLFIFDAGYARAIQSQKTGLPPEFQSQLIFLLIAAGASWWAASIPSVSWKKWSKLAWVINLLLLMAVPIFGHQLNGAKRWIGYGIFTIQPAEFAKLAAIIYLAGYFADRKAWPQKIKYPKHWISKMDNVWIPKLMRCFPAIWVMIGVAFIEYEPDLGTGAVIAATGFAMFFPARVTTKSIYASVVVAAILCTGAMLKEPYRVQRFTHHIQRWKDENFDELEFQSVQAELAISSGGVPGVGLGAGRAKHVLPATTTDFIWATVGEESGLWGSVIVLSVLGGIVFRLLYLARIAKNRFDMLLLFGVGSWIGIQTCVNVMMANAFLPAIGIPLPFISSGGSSLIALWMALGVCQATLAPVQDKPKQIKQKRTSKSGGFSFGGYPSRSKAKSSTTLNRLKVTSKPDRRERV